MYRVWRFLSEYSVLLVLGALIGLVWANLDPASYHAFVEFPLLEGGPVGHLHVDAEGHAHRTLTLHYLINDVLMALFFAIAGKEVWEAVALGSGALRGRKAMTPLIATAGGMVGPVAVYLARRGDARQLRRAGARLGDPDRDRHRLLLPRRAAGVRRRAPGGDVPAAARDRRRRRRADHPRGLLPAGRAGAGLAAAVVRRGARGLPAGEPAAADAGRPAATAGPTRPSSGARLGFWPYARRRGA